MDTLSDRQPIEPRTPGAVIRFYVGITVLVLLVLVGAAMVWWRVRPAPIVAGRTPPDGATDVSVRAAIRIAFSALYCSPVLRAVQTAEIVGQRLGLTPEVADGLREWYTGILEGQKYSKETEGLHWWATAQWMVHDNHDARVEGGESCNDIRARFMPLIGSLEQRCRDTETNVLLVSHGGTLRCMLPLLVSNLDNASVLHRPFSYATPIIVELRDGEWVCLRWGEDVL